MLTSRTVPVVVLGMLLLLITPALMAADMSVREWRRDMENLKTKVFDPLSERMKSEGQNTSWHAYMVDMLDLAAVNQEEISAFSYGVLRDTTLTMGQDFTRFANDSNWADAEYYLQTKLDLITRVLGYLELDRN